MDKKTIGLCLSGGGHRATVFSLGALLYLADVGRHKQIHAISSVSGGSLTSGFLATRNKPLHRQTPEEVEETVRSLASKVKGRPHFFWLALSAVLALFVAWFLHLNGHVSFGVSFWESQLVLFALLAAVALLAGRLCGGTFWGWWGTWMYLGLVLSALVVGIAIWWSEAHWILRFIVSVFAFSIPLLRCRVAEMAFAATIFRGKESQITLAQLPDTPRYVFCATEMHTGQHALFSRDFIYIPRLGLGVPRNLAVKTAVQMSANFPVAFPYRLLWSSNFRFPLNQILDRPLFLVLSDGGVYDNMATSWFKEGPQHAANLQISLSKVGLQEPGDAQLREDLEKQINAMKRAKPDYVIVVNSSEPYTWKRAGQSVLPLWGEMQALLGINNSMYNQLGGAQKNKLRREFFLKPNSGALVSIGEHPRYLVACLASPMLRERFLASNELTEQDVEPFRSKALRMTLPPDETSGEEESDLSLRISELRRGVEDLPKMSAARAKLEKQIFELEWKKHKLDQARSNRMLERGFDRLQESAEWGFRTQDSKTVATTFRALGKATTGMLLAHGYVSAMTNCHLLLDFPLVDEIPSVEEFERLAEGLARRRRPTALEEPGPNGVGPRQPTNFGER